MLPGPAELGKEAEQDLGQGRKGTTGTPAAFCDLEL